ncbi:MAG: DotI/IcmL/TraM family protein [Alphaproteobacteria bacterium]
MADAGRDTNETDIDNPAIDPAATDAPAPAASNPMSMLSKVLGGKPAAPATAAAAAVEKPAAPKKGSVAENPITKPAPMPGGPLVSVVTRNEFYRDGFRNLIKIVILEGVIIVGLILTLIVHINNSVAYDRYFATTADGRIMQLSPLNERFLTDSALVSWVAQAATEVMTFGFHDYQRRLQQASRHFTKTGWETFSTAMEKARIIESVTAQRQVVVASPRSAPVIRQHGVAGGKYRWVLEMPMSVEYRAREQARTENLKLTLVVERVSSLENPNGVGIQQWLAESGQ